MVSGKEGSDCVEVYVNCEVAENETGGCLGRTGKYIVLQSREAKDCSKQRRLISRVRTIVQKSDSQ